MRDDLAGRHAWPAPSPCDETPTGSGFVMAPVALWAGGAGQLRPDPGQVHAVFRAGEQARHR